MITKEERLVLILVAADKPIPLDDLAFKIYGSRREADLKATYALIARARKTNKIVRVSAFWIEQD